MRAVDSANTTAEAIQPRVQLYARVEPVVVWQLDKRAVQEDEHQEHVAKDGGDGALADQKAVGGIALGGTVEEDPQDDHQLLLWDKEARPLQSRVVFEPVDKPPEGLLVDSE